MNRTDIISHGEELLNTGSLSWRRNSGRHKRWLRCNFHMVWPSHSDVFSCSASDEEIVFTSSLKSNYKSVHHFAWSVLLFQRAIDHKEEVRQVVSGSVSQEVSVEEGLNKMRKWCKAWFVEYGQLMPEFKLCYVVVDRDLEIYMVFETKDKYFGWAWSSRA